MAQWYLGTGSFWLLVVALGAGAFGFRLSFIQLHAWIDDIPPRVERALEFVPPAILAALVFPQLFTLDGSVVGVFLDVHVLAGGLAAATAWRTGSMLATIGVGMGVLWSAQLLVG